MKIKIGPQKLILKLIDSLKKTQPLSNEGITEDKSNCTYSLDVLQAGCSTASTSTTCNNASSSSSLIDESKFSHFNSVRETLKNNLQGGPILKALDSLLFNESDRRSLVRIIVTELVTVQQTYYPPHAAKLALAKAVVTEFPQLKNNLSSKGWEHFLTDDGKNGFIEYRLLTMRTSLSPSKKKYAGAAMKKLSKTKERVPLKSLDNTFTSEEIDEKISVMKCKNPTDINREIISQYLDETRNHRRYWIESENPTISEIFKMYPRLLDYDGEMIDREFDVLYPKSTNNFLTKFPTLYVPKILFYAKKFRSSLFVDSAIIKDDNLRALLILVELLPVSNASLTKKGKGPSKGKKRKLDENDEKILSTKKTFPNEYLLKIVPDGTVIADYVQKVRQHSDESVQPYLITLSGQAGDRTFLQGDEWLININPKSEPISGFDLLYKTYYVLNVKYPESLKNFYNFIDCFIFQRNDKPKSVVSSLHVTLLNLKIDHDENESSDE